MNKPSYHLRGTLLAAVLIVCGGGIARAEQTAHPAVVRIIVPDRTGTSFGSGTLVAVSGEHGLVVTNWHVVRDAAGQITVAFPDGFRSGARLLKVDRDWDLAALAIWRPNAQPVPLSATVPRRGDVLSIAGWGNGSYRMKTGRCTQYVSPGGNHPFEMIELGTGARNGDSGGPILNERGELAGVLFGSAFGRTTGSYSGRVRWFLASVDRQFRQLPSQPTVPSREGMIAQRQQPGRTPLAAIGSVRAMQPPRGQITTEATASLLPAEYQSNPVAVVLPAADATAEAAVPYREGPTRGDQIKTILAGIGLVLLLFHGMRLLGGFRT